MSGQPDFSGVTVGIDGSGAVSALVAIAAVLALVGFAKWAAKKIGGFFDNEGGGWSTANQDAQGHWYEHNSDEPGVRYYYEGPNAGQRVVMDAAEDSAERLRLEAQGLAGMSQAALDRQEQKRLEGLEMAGLSGGGASPDDDERMRERESLYNYAADMYGTGQREDWESERQYQNRMDEVDRTRAEMPEEDRRRFEEEVQGRRS